MRPHSTSARRNTLRALALSCGLWALSACGGGGGGAISTPGPQPAPAPAPSPAPSPTPSPSPTPTPTPTPPPSSFDTAEFRRSDGPDFHNAVAAWQRGATGRGETIAVIDTGIDTDSPEFAGRLSPLSADVAANRSVEAEDDHGTHVSLIAAAARNNTGILGIAFDATVLALRADTPGSCADVDPADPSNSCSFADSSIARGIDRAVSAGATVINISLGGGAPSDGVRAAVQRAAAAGIVVVVSAGNDGEGGGSTDPAQPDPFATGVLQSGGGNVIIVGSVDASGQISAFSNRAGSQANSFLTALGERICCVYQDGSILVTTRDGQQFVTLFSGTSFSAPQVSGAVALLAQAFPNLSGAQIVRILLESARDAGATGIDPVYGRGILDIARAFAPQGTTTLAGGTTLALADDVAVGSAAMGDATQGTAGLQAIILDGYGRAYDHDLGARLRGATVQPRLNPALGGGSRQVALGGAGVSLAFSITDDPHQDRGRGHQLRLTRDEAEGARVLAARAAFTLSPEMQMGFAFRQGSDGLVAQLQGQERPAFLIAGDARSDAGFTVGTDAAFALRRQVGPWGLTASAERGEAWLGAYRRAGEVFGRVHEKRPTATFSIAADRYFGNIEASIGASWLREDRTVLGAHFHDALGAGGASTLFLDASADWRFAPGWRAGAQMRQGWTRADRQGLVSTGSNLTSRAWSIDLGRQGVFGPFDFLGVRLSQPLRVESGGLSLYLPVGYSYASERASYAQRSLSLAPRGREIDGEIAWRGPLWGGEAAASMFYRKDPGHYASTPDDKGAAIKWTAKF